MCSISKLPWVQTKSPRELPPLSNNDQHDLHAGLRCEVKQQSHFRLPAVPGKLRSAAPTVQAFCIANHIPDAISNRMNLALDEVLSNIAKYAYAALECGSIEVELMYTDNRFIATVHDAGKPFNPLLFHRPDNNGPMERRKQGELGILFVKSVTDSVAYDRSDDQNKLTLTINVPVK